MHRILEKLIANEGNEKRRQLLEKWATASPLSDEGKAIRAEFSALEHQPRSKSQEPRARAILPKGTAVGLPAVPTEIAAIANRMRDLLFMRMTCATERDLHTMNVMEALLYDKRIRKMPHLLARTHSSSGDLERKLVAELGPNVDHVLRHETIGNTWQRPDWRQLRQAFVERDLQVSYHVTEVDEVISIARDGFLRNTSDVSRTKGKNKRPIYKVYMGNDISRLRYYIDGCGSKVNDGGWCVICEVRYDGECDEITRWPNGFGGYSSGLGLGCCDPGSMPNCVLFCVLFGIVASDSGVRTAPPIP